MRKTFVLLLFIGLVNQVMAAPAQSPGVQELLKKAVIDGEAKLDQLETWQKKLFDEEIVPEYARFVRDYRPSSQGLVIDIDYDAIKKYLYFYAPKALKTPYPSNKIPLLLYVNAEAECVKCTASSEDVKVAIKPRLERRGFVVAGLSQKELPDIIGPTNPANRANFSVTRDKLVKYSSQKNQAGVFYVQIQTMPADPDDTAHADEIRYQVVSYLYLKQDTDFPEFKSNGQLEVLENDSIERSVVRLFTDTMTELGGSIISKVNKTKAELSEGITLTVNGIKGFESYTKLKAVLEAKGISGLEEKKILRGSAVFIIRSISSVDEFKGKVLGASLEPGKLLVTDANEKSITMEIK